MKKWLQRLGLRRVESSTGEMASRTPLAASGTDSTKGATLEHAERMVDKGNALEERGLHAEAEACYKEVIRIFPEGTGIRIHLGNLYFDQQRLDEAQACYEQALALSPASPGALYSLARVRIERVQLPDASRLLQAAITADPTFVPALLTHGLVCERLGDLPTALARFGQLIAIRPRDRDALVGFAAMHLKLEHLEEAYDATLRVLQVAPEDAEGWALRGELEFKFGLIPEAIDSQRRAVELRPNSVDYCSMLLFMMNYSPDMDPAELLREHLKFGERFGVPGAGSGNPSSSRPDRHRRLNVGYVSGDFREHVVARFLEPVLARHDAARVQVFAYQSQSQEDATTATLKRRVRQWRNISGMPDDEVEALIRTDRIDILIDLSGHTANQRLTVFARKPAPIQATWLGYPSTTGIRQMDYVICDPYTNPAGESEHWSVERPARMPACQWCLPLSDDLPAINELPMLDNGFVTFGSFNNVVKINDRVVDVWVAILREVPASKLVFFRVPAGRAQSRLVTLLGERGVGRDRFELRGYRQPAMYHRGYLEVDIALDPFPYNGFTTSFDSLAMGVPFIALAGDRSSARGGLSILANVGLPDLVAHTPEGYVAIAKALASDPVRLRSLRAGLRNRLAESPLADIEQFTRDLESLYRTWWQRWCDAQESADRDPDV